MKKKLIKALLFVFTAVLTFFCCMGVGCNLPQSEHVCLYDNSAERLQKVDTETPHDIEGKMVEWAKDVTAAEGEEVVPSVTAYVLTYEYTVPTGTVITLGANVYVGICTHSADLVFEENQIQLTYADAECTQPISGFYTYNCNGHGCYEMLDVTGWISSDYLEFFYVKALSEGKTQHVIPAGRYCLEDVCPFAQWLTEEKVAFADPSATEICTNNLALAPEDELALRSLGINVYTQCKEDEVDNTTHVCAYIPDAGLNSLPVGQETFDLAMTAISNGSLQLSPNLKTESGNFYIIHLTEDVSSNVAFTAPDGEYFGICKNGFAFDAPNLENVYVFDCKPHVCMYNNCQEHTPLYQSGLEFISTLYTAAYKQPLVLPEGNYALMENFDVAKLPVQLSASYAYNVCANGFTVAGAENGLGENVSVLDCTQPANVMHACDKLHPYISAMYFNEEVLGTAVDENGVLRVGEREVAFAMPADFVIDTPVTIPTGTTMHLCLNGFTLQASEYLVTRLDSPYLFVVEYGAELHICDCSAEQSGAIVSCTPEMLGLENFNMSNSPIFNFGTVVLDSVTAQGAIGVENSGKLYVNNSKILGLFAGVGTMSMDEQDYPLQTNNHFVKIKNSTVEGIIVGVADFAGETTIEDTVINAGAVGILNTMNLGNLELEGTLGSSEAQGQNLTISNVTVNLGAVSFEEANEIIQAITQATGGGIAIASASDVVLEGDFVVNVADKALRPYVDDAGKLISPTIIDIALPEGAKLNIADGVKLSDTYSLLIQTESEDAQWIVSNEDLSENFILMEGLVGVTNKNQDYVVSTNQAFMNNAVVLTHELSFDGYIRLKVTFQFDADEKTPSFYKNEKAGVIFNVAGQKTVVHPSEMESLGGNQYVYYLDFYAQDYYDTINVQFTDGEYIWTGMRSVSVGSFLEYTLYDMDKTLEEYDNILSTDAAEKQAWEETKNNAPDDATLVEPTFTYTEEQVAEAKLSQEGYKALRNAVIVMYNYCSTASAHFYEHKAYMLLDTHFTHKTVDVIIQEQTQNAVWTKKVLADAMNEITAETLQDYRMAVKEGAKVPQGVSVLGASLVLNAGTDIRCYMQIDASVMQTLTFTVNGREVTPVRSSGNLYYVLIDNLSAIELKTMFEISVTDGVDTFTLSYGVFSYMYNVLNDANASEELVNVAKAMWLYADEIEKAYKVIINLGNSGNTDGENAESGDEESGEEVNGDENV